MKILVACIIQLVTALAAYQYMTCRVDGKLQTKELLRLKLDWKSLTVVSAAFVISVCILIKGLVWDQDGFVRSLMNAEVLIGLSVMGYIDLREKIIPNGLIGVGLLLWAALLLIDIFVAKTPWADVLKFSLLGGIAVGGGLFLIALFGKSALGMGDVKMFLVLGLLYGLSDAYSILLFSLIIMAIVSLVLLATKKVTVKTSIPVAPFVVLGFILCIIAGM